jgi:hypothetical protein
MLVSHAGSLRLVFQQGDLAEPAERIGAVAAAGSHRSHFRGSPGRMAPSGWLHGSAGAWSRRSARALLWFPLLVEIRWLSSGDEPLWGRSSAMLVA